MSHSTSNIVRVRVFIKGTRPFLQHEFTSESIALESQERSGVAGNDPEEWKKSCMVTPQGQLYFRGDYVFSCLRNAGKFTKKGRGSILPLISATLQIEENIILLNRQMPEGGPRQKDFDANVYIDVRPVRNPKTKGRNVRYRLACSPGWECNWTMIFDKTIVSRPEMQSTVLRAGLLCGLGDGIGVGMGRFDVLKYEELSGAEEETSEGTVELEEGRNPGKGRRKVRAMQEETFFGNGAH